MLRFRPLPWDYGIRNLFRRPGRSLLTLTGLTLVVFLVFVVVAFVRGLEANLAVSGDPRVVLVHSLRPSENVENSSVPGRTAALLTASVGGVLRRYGEAYASSELYLGTQVSTEDDAAKTLGLLRGGPALAETYKRVLVAAEAAVRAVRECSPFDLPADKYSTWRTITWEFDPSQMM